MKNDINWTEIQRFYDDGNSVSETSKNFKISERQLYKASKSGIKAILQEYHM
jgi:DNA invertase Pin-like site-specific DNA recombinase